MGRSTAFGDGAARTLAGAGFVAILLAPCPAAADEMPIFKVEMADGVITPARIEVPADVPFKLEITNSGKTPSEFESNELKREKVLAAGSTSSIVFRRVAPGEYPFFDDFHPEAKAVLVAR